MAPVDPTADWPPGTGEMVRHIRGHPWDTTPLGPVAGWTGRLKGVVEQILASPLLASLAIGPDRLIIYNDTAARLFAAYHPGMLGRPLATVFADSYPTVAHLYDRAFAGETVHRPAQDLNVTGNGEVFDAYLIPIRDDAGEVMAVHMTGFEVSARLRAERRLRESETRYRAFVTASSDAVYRMGPDWTDLRDLDGRGFLADTTGPGQSWLDRCIGPDDRPEVEVAIADATRRKELFDLEHRVRRADGTSGWAHSRVVPILDDAGAIVEWLGAAQDITDRVEAERQLHVSEERLRSAAEVARFALWDWDLRTGDTTWTANHFRMMGYAVGEIAPSHAGWLSRVHPDDRAGAEAAIAHARDAHVDYAHEFRSLHPDGSVHWLSARGRFFYDKTGEAVRMIGAMLDVTEKRDAEEHQKVLVAELQHRTRNLMGVVRAMADKIGRTSTDLADFRIRFNDRLDALARVQGLLSRLTEHDRVTFDDLIRTELRAMSSSHEQITLAGPGGVRLRSSTVQTLAMAVHELATNAVKYGALGQPEAHLSVTWSLEPSDVSDAPLLHIDWRETGVIPQTGHAPRDGGGQGRELIERALPYQLRASTSYVLTPDGVHCTISIPVSASNSGQG